MDRKKLVNTGKVENPFQWCEKKDIQIHTMKYWLRKQSPVSKNPQETACVSCMAEEPSKRHDYVENTKIEMLSGLQDECYWGSVGHLTNYDERPNRRAGVVRRWTDRPSEVN